MATMNPFDLLGDDAEDPSQLIAAQPQKIAAATKKELGQGKPVAAAAQQNKPAKLPSKPLPPAQAVRETKTEAVRGGGRGVGRGFGRGRGGGGRGYDRDSVFNKNSYNTGVPGAPEDGEVVKSSERRGYGGPRGPYRGGFGNGEAGDEERTRRPFERRSGTGRGNEFKRGGSGQSNWGTPIDELSQVTEEVTNEKRPGDVKPVVEEVKTDLNKETPANESEEKEPEDKEMTLEEYEKILEEKRKALLARKTEERKVDVKVFESMQQLSNKKGNDDIFIKLGSEKDKHKEAEKDEKVKKSVSINEFLKPAVGERYQGQGGRGRGRGSRGFSARDGTSNVQAPAIEDEWQFPTLGGK